MSVSRPLLRSGEACKALSAGLAKRQYTTITARQISGDEYDGVSSYWRRRRSADGLSLRLISILTSSSAIRTAIRCEGRAPLRDWTQALIRKLKDQLRSLETEFNDLHIWMDPEIDPTANLTDELRKKANASGVLMIVMSKRYLNSSWCRDELEWFREQIRGPT